MPYRSSVTVNFVCATKFCFDPPFFNGSCPRALSAQYSAHHTSRKRQLARFNRPSFLPPWNVLCALMRGSNSPPTPTPLPPPPPHPPPPPPSMEGLVLKLCKHEVPPSTQQYSESQKSKPNKFHVLQFIFLCGHYPMLMHYWMYHVWKEQRSRTDHNLYLLVHQQLYDFPPVPQYLSRMYLPESSAPGLRTPRGSVADSLSTHRMPDTRLLPVTVGVSVTIW